MKFDDGHRVLCDECGSQGLTEEEYRRQMLKPDSFWQCPVCRDSAEWDDDSYELWLDYVQEEYKKRMN